MELTKVSDVDSVARFQSLQAGQYWRAREEILEEAIEKDEVLLIQSIRWVEDAPHTVILRPHPSKIGTSITLKVPQPAGGTKTRYVTFNEHRFLLHDFLNKFEAELDATAVRAAEVQAIQQRVAGLQSELLDAQRNPALLQAVVDAEMEAETVSKGNVSQPLALPPADAQAAISAVNGSVSNVIAGGITTEGIAAMKAVAQREHDVATIKAGWIKGKTSEIAETLQKMAPFYEEQAAAALAQTEDVRSYVAKLMKGIESLDLYVGKDVEVHTITQGNSAPREVPLTLVQKKLAMDEELALWADVDKWFDFEKEEKFFAALAENKELVDQIFPTQRCVLVMVATLRDIDYGDSLVNAHRNIANKRVFLMIRDGENIYRVFSSVESHLGTARLFPSKNDQDKIFKGFDGSEVKFEDVAFTDRLARHEMFALHYKRFLLLLCGLDHRLKLLGDFYEGAPTMAFVSLAFQHRYFNFIHDDDGAGLLPAEARLPVAEWRAERNAYLRSGSRVLCHWRALLNPDTAPGVCKVIDRYEEQFDRRYDPAQKYGVAIVYRVDDSLFVDVEVSGSKRDGEARTFKAKVNLTKYRESYWRGDDGMAFLCLDAVHPSDLSWYMRNRAERRHHLEYVRFFKHALAYLETERATEAASRAELARALEIGNFSTPAERSAIIDQAVIAWRAANRGQELPSLTGSHGSKAWKSLLDQMYMLAGEGKQRVGDVERFVGNMGYRPLRLVLTGAAKMMIYAEPTSNERVDAVEPHVWVHCITVEMGKAGLVEKGRKWSLLAAQSASETTLHQWEEAKDWAGRKSIFSSHAHKVSVMESTTDFAAKLAPYLAQMDEATFMANLHQWEEARDAMCEKSGQVRNPSFAVPIGVVHLAGSESAAFICVGTYDAHALLHQLAPNEESKQRLRRAYVSMYANKEVGKNSFDANVGEPFEWQLLMTEVSLADARFSQFCGYGTGVNIEMMKGKPNSPLLADWFDGWLKEADKATTWWMAPGATVAGTELVLDEMLNICLPINFSPVHVRNIKLHMPDGESDLYAQWFDICTDGRAADGFHSLGLGRDKELTALVQSSMKEKSYGYSSGLDHFYSRALAQEHIARSAVREKRIAVRAEDLPDAPKPPDGIERWYSIKQ